MGEAVAQRLGSGSTLVLADVSEPTLRNAADSLRSVGYDVIEHVTDVSNEDSVVSLAEAAAGLWSGGGSGSHRGSISGTGVG